MNWAVIIQAVLVFGAGIFGSTCTYLATKTKSSANNEAVYAHSMPEMINRVQDLLEQLESKNGKIAELTVQVETQSHTIDELTKQVGKMQEQITRLTKGSSN
ncbi:hypothetical protein ABC418_17310 [Lactiplantibacillus plantarum]|uniref:hypothetical protein n=1 Tax=Lactiplantibacillus plantarum TaxID=1590 RepID=UPI003965AEEE